MFLCPLFIQLAGLRFFTLCLRSWLLYSFIFLVWLSLTTSLPFGPSLSVRHVFVQIFHKMDSIRHMMTGVAPPVRVTGPVRDFIMAVRTQPMEVCPVALC